MPGEWLAQLPEDLRTNEAFTGHATLGDFAKSHLEAQGKLKEFDGKATELTGKVTDLEGRLANTIPKLSEKATPEEQVAFWKSLGVPDKPELYEFPKGDGIEHDEGMVKWAQGVFHQAHLTPQQAALIGQQWDSFVKGMVEAEEKETVKAKQEAEIKFKADLGNDEGKYKEAVELVKRVWKKLSDSEFNAFVDETGIGNDHRFIKFVHEIAKKTGEDMSPSGSPVRGPETKPGMIYDKTPEIRR